MPPLYYFLLHGWGLVSQELGWLRLLSLILSIGVVIVSYLWMCRLAGRQVGLLTAFIVAISPLQIYHAQDLRPYALLSLTILSYWYFFLRLWQDGKKQQVLNWIGLILASLASLYTHNLAGFMLLPPYFFLLFRKNWKWLLKLGGLHLITLLFFLPWLMVLPGQIEKIQTAFWTPRPGIVEVFQTTLMWASNLPLSEPLLLIASVLVISSFILVIMETWRARRRLGDLTFVLWCSFLPGLLLFVISYIMRPVYVSRGMLATYLALDGLAAWVVWQGWQKGGGKLLLGALVLAAAVTLPYQITYLEFPRSPFEKAMTDLTPQVQEGDVILHDIKLSFFPSLFYAPDLPQKFLADIPGSSNDTYAVGSQEAMQLFPDENIEVGSEGANRVIFIMFEQTRMDYLALGLTEHPALAWLNDHGKVEKVETWTDLKAYFYRMEP